MNRIIEPQNIDIALKSCHFLKHFSENVFYYFYLKYFKKIFRNFNFFKIITLNILEK